MSGKAAKIMCTEKQQRILQQMRRSTTAPQRLVQRVGIILTRHSRNQTGVRKQESESRNQESENCILFLIPDLWLLIPGP